MSHNQETINKNDQNISAFRIIPEWLFDLDLTSSEILLYGLLLGLTGQRGYCWANNHYLSEKSRVEIRQLQKMLQKLSTLRLINVIYTENERKIYITSRHEMTPPHVINNTPPCHRRHTPHVIEDTHNNININIQDNINNNLIEPKTDKTTNELQVTHFYISFSDYPYVKITNVEKVKLMEFYRSQNIPDNYFEQALEELNTYLINNPKKKYKSHYLVLRGWVLDRIKQKVITDTRLGQAQKTANIVNLKDNTKLMLETRSTHKSMTERTLEMVSNLILKEKAKGEKNEN